MIRNVGEIRKHSSVNLPYQKWIYLSNSDIYRRYFESSSFNEVHGYGLGETTLVVLRSPFSVPVFLELFKQIKFLPLVDCWMASMLSVKKSTECSCHQSISQHHCHPRTYVWSFLCISNKQLFICGALCALWIWLFFCRCGLMMLSSFIIKFWKKTTKLKEHYGSHHSILNYKLSSIS